MADLAFCLNLGSQLSDYLIHCQFHFRNCYNISFKSDLNHESLIKNLFQNFFSVLLPHTIFLFTVVFILFAISKLKLAIGFAMMLIYLNFFRYIFTDAYILYYICILCLCVCVSVSLSAISPSKIFRPSVCPSVSYKEHC